MPRDRRSNSKVSARRGLGDLRLHKSRTRVLPRKRTLAVFRWALVRGCVFRARISAAAVEWPRLTWTYSESEATDRDQVRGKIGDTDTNRQLLANETIDAVLVTYATVISASIECCRRIIAKLARDVDRSALGMSASRSQIITHYRDLIVELKAEAAIQGEVFVGGVSQTDVDAQIEDTDAVQPTFTVGQMDNPG